MVPAISSLTEGRSILENLKLFLFNPYPTHQGDPGMNIYLALVLSTFGFETKYFLFILVALHLLSAFLFYTLLRRMGLEFRIAFFSAIVYLATFIHFSYYTWPMSAHHLFVLFLSLVILNLYFETTARFDAKGNWKPVYWLTIGVNFLAPFCQITILLLPAAILAHILISAKDGGERLKKYDLWLPLFITYLGYPVMRFLCVGYIHLERFLHFANNASRNMALFPAVFAAGVGALFIFRGFIKYSSRYKLGRIFKILCIAAVVLYLAVFIAVSGRSDLTSPSKVKLHDFLSPYNFLRPFGIMFMNFISPIRSALSIDSTMTYHIIPPRDTLAGNLICLLLIGIFVSKYLFKHRGLIVFLLFYAVALRYMRILTTMLYSRHFLYVTPLFAVVFSGSFVYIYDWIISRIKLKKVIQEIVLVIIFVGLCVPNIFAIKTALARGRLVNTFLIYDYIRAANIIKNDTVSTPGRINANDISIKGVVPMPFNVDEYWSPGPGDPLRFAPFRYAFGQVFNDRSMAGININRPAAAGRPAYEIRDFRVYDSHGRNVDRFSSCVDEGLQELRMGNDKKALSAFNEAIKVRPFLFKFILPGDKLSDIGWITNGTDLKTWIKDIYNYNNNCDEEFYVAKIKYVQATITSEIADYLKALSCAASLDEKLGRAAESKELLSYIRYIDSNYSIDK